MSPRGSRPRSAQTTTGLRIDEDAVHVDAQPASAGCAQLRHCHGQPAFSDVMQGGHPLERQGDARFVEDAHPLQKGRTRI